MYKGAEAEDNPPVGETPGGYKNLKGIYGHGWELALSNRWNVLTVDEIKDENQLEKAKWWVDTLNKIGKEFHLLKTLNYIKTSCLSCQKLEKVITEGMQPCTSLTTLQETSIQDQNGEKLAIQKFSKLESLRNSQKINDLLLKNKGQAFHRLIQQGKDILKARAEYSAKVASDPTGISTDPTKCTHVRPKEVKHKQPSD
ncbi:hypothetical protein VP01_6622g1, partial [Puccinia sorghi]